MATSKPQSGGARPPITKTKPAGGVQSSPFKKKPIRAIPGAMTTSRRPY